MTVKQEGEYRFKIFKLILDALGDEIAIEQLRKKEILIFLDIFQKPSCKTKKDVV